MTIRVGLTERHGLADELSLSAPTGVEYSFLKAESGPRFITSPIKGFFDRFAGRGVDLVEAVLCPIDTDAPWVMTLPSFEQAMAFGLGRAPLPRPVRLACVRHVLARGNFKRLIFRSRAGLQSFLDRFDYVRRGLAHSPEVVYPSVRVVSDELVRQQDGGSLTLLFTGDFFRKGGVNVLDAFERAQPRYAGLRLILCCDETVDFRTADSDLRQQSLARIGSNPAIVSRGRVARRVLLSEILPNVDVFLMPTYVETFGFAILEAMAYGLPIISTNHFAIPEMIEHGVSGLLVDTSEWDCEQLFKGYAVNALPDAFRSYVSDQVYRYLCELIESRALRSRLGRAALGVVRSKFSIDVRNAALLRIYRQALVE